MWLHNATPELDDQSRYPTIIATAAATTVLMLIVASMRFFVRVRIVKNLGADDWCVMVSVITSLVYTSGAIIQTRYGLGLPPPKYPPQNMRQALVLNYTFRPFYCIAVSAFKIALCFAYLRITSNSSARKYRMAIWAAMTFTICFTIYYISIVIFACSPIHKYWERSTPGKCLPIPMVYYSPAVITIIIDVILFFLPIPLVLRLHMNNRRKTGLVIAFLLGLITTVCSVMRLVGSINVARKSDPQRLIVWAVMETNIGIITTSLPTLAPLLKKSRFQQSKQSSSSGRGSGKNKSGLSVKMQALANRGDSAGGTTATTPSPKGRTKFESASSSQEEILPSPRSKAFGAKRASDIEKGGSVEYIKLDFPITRTLDIDMASGPLCDEAETGHMKELRRLRGV